MSEKTPPVSISEDIEAAVSAAIAPIIRQYPTGHWTDAQVKEVVRNAIIAERQAPKAVLEANLRTSSSGLEASSSDLQPPVSILGALPQDVINLVIAAREAFDTGGLPIAEGRQLDKALEPFSARVPYENEPEPCLSQDEQRAQALRCGCKGSDEYCGCQNTPDKQTLAERSTREGSQP